MKEITVPAITANEDVIKLSKVLVKENEYCKKNIKAEIRKEEKYKFCMNENNFVDNLFSDEEDWINENIDDESKLNVFATGGNINKIQDMTRTKSGKPISYLSIKDLYNNLLDEDINDRMIKYNLNPDRADVIIPALRIFISTMEWANTNKLFVPKVGLVDGMIKEIHNSMNSVN